ncbi:hypothetical protein SCUCBS95973_007062 [Sporothrix curviconia]|uniref:Uncharacterized protein n=1 Tax=Sporothrix curviconia TaxID=1260050 RepID=A0ABP0CA78_9PEZI
MRSWPLVVLLVGAAVDGNEGVDARVVANARDADNNEHCPHDNLLRCLVGSPLLAYTFCSWSVGIYATPVTIYDTVTVPATDATLTMPPQTSDSESTTPTTADDTDADTPTATATATSAVSSGASVSTVTITQLVTLDHTQTTTDTVIETVSVVATAPLPSSPSSATISISSVSSISADIASRAVHTPRTTPKTALACLEDLEPALDDVTSACACFASSQPTPTSTATVTWAQGSPYCPAGASGAQKQPTFPNCFADFHPYNCGTDHAGQVACSCALTTEGTSQCTLGDYERDNACTTSDDCAAGWYCTAIECFGADVSSICTQACPVLFSQGGDGGDGGGGGNDNNGTDDGGESDNDSAMPAGHARLGSLGDSLASGHNSNRNLSIIIVNNDAHGFGNGRARGSAARSGHSQA